MKKVSRLQSPVSSQKEKRRRGKRPLFFALASSLSLSLWLETGDWRLETFFPVQVDKGAFLMFVSSLALGGAAGYVASEKDLVPHIDKKTPPPAPTPIVAEAPKDAGPPPPAVSAATAPPVIDAGPLCDDNGEATPEACPPVGYPTIEGGCGALTFNRCNDFKQVMKPRVAKAAIHCLNKLSPGEKCDPKRIDLCAHLALMNACEDKAPTIEASCGQIERACAAASITPSKSECAHAMAGLREVGRDTMVECAKKHCADRGIVGCEAIGVGKIP